MLKYDSIAELVNEAEKRGLKLSELVLKTQAAMTERQKKKCSQPWSDPCRS